MSLVMDEKYAAAKMQLCKESYEHLRKILIETHGEVKALDMISKLFPQFDVYEKEYNDTQSKEIH